METLTEENSEDNPGLQALIARYLGVSQFLEAPEERLLVEPSQKLSGPGSRFIETQRHCRSELCSRILRLRTTVACQICAAWALVRREPSVPRRAP